MTSGFRLTVALVLVALIAIGFYFANLEGADRSEEAELTRDPEVVAFEPAPAEPPSEPTVPSVNEPDDRRPENTEPAAIVTSPSSDLESDDPEDAQAVASNDDTAAVVGLPSEFEPDGSPAVDAAETPETPAESEPSTEADGTVDSDASAAGSNDRGGRSAAELPASAYTSYTIQAGDNFERIATAWFGDPRKQSLIAIANPTVDPIRLQIGQIIKLPPKDTPLAIERGEPTEAGVVIHVVRSGETLSDIAVEYLGKASRWQEIHDANRDVIGDDPARLAVGMELRIP